MDKYIITDATLVLFSLGSKTQVYEKYTNYVVNKTLIDIIEENCKYYGSSLKGRCEATEFLTGIKYKCPIILSEMKHLIFFPTTSFKSEDCVWFNYRNIESYYNKDNYHLVVWMKGNKKVEINISNNVMSNQILKASRLDSILNNIR